MKAFQISIVAFPSRKWCFEKLVAVSKTWRLGFLLNHMKSLDSLLLNTSFRGEFVVRKRNGSTEYIEKDSKCFYIVSSIWPIIEFTSCRRALFCVVYSFLVEKCIEWVWIMIKFCFMKQHSEGVSLRCTYTCSSLNGIGMRQFCCSDLSWSFSKCRHYRNS